MATTSPIEHVVIIFKENHTFDNYFGTFPGVDGDATLAHAPNPPLSDHDHRISVAEPQSQPGQGAVPRSGHPGLFRLCP